MKTNKRKFTMCILAIVCLTVIAIFAKNIFDSKNSNSAKVAFKEDPSPNVPDNENITSDIAQIKANNAQEIVWSVPDICSISKENVDALNSLLAQDGYDLKLSLKALSYDEYPSALDNVLKYNMTDIAFVGVENSTDNNIYSLLKSGSFLELDSLLQDGAGKLLYDAFPEQLWNSVKCDNKIYSIPSSVADDEGIYFAFNTKYVDERTIEQFDCSLESIDKILDNIKWTNSDLPPFQYLISGFDFVNLFDCGYDRGLLYDYTDGKITSPFDNERFISYVTTLNDIYSKGQTSDPINFSDNPGMNDPKTLAVIDANDYAIAIGKGTVNKCFLDNDIIIVKAPAYLQSRLRGSIGINSSSPNTEKSLEFLSILYTNDKYANTLLYGTENVDYKIEDGIVKNLDGSEKSKDFFNQLALNLFINVLPVDNDSFITDRRSSVFSHYNTMKENPFLGFEILTLENQAAICSDMDNFLYSCAHDNIMDIIAQFKEQLSKDNIEEIVNATYSQWEEYKNGVSAQ